MRRRRTAPHPARSVPGEPDDLAEERRRAEDAVAHTLRLVDRAVIEVKPQRPVGGEAVARRRHARLEPREVGRVDGQRSSYATGPAARGPPFVGRAENVAPTPNGGSRYASCAVAARTCRPTSAASHWTRRLGAVAITACRTR